MPVSNDIFELVKIMTRKERSFFRRYFRLHSAGRDGSMLRLFEKLAEYSSRSEKYEEDVLKAMLDKDTAKHLPVTKNNLYRLILKSLNEYREEDSNDEKVKSLIEQYEMLFSRSLLKQAEGVLKKAKKIANENELFMPINSILNKQRVLARYMLDAESYSERVRSIYREQVENLEKIRNLVDMYNLGTKVTELTQRYPTSMSRDAEHIKEKDEVLNSPLLNDETKMLSSTTLKRFYNINVVVSEWRKDYSSALLYARKYAEEVEKDVDKNKSTIHDYIISYYSVITASTRTNDTMEYERAYEKLAAVNTRFGWASERDKLEAFYWRGLSVFSSSAEKYHIERGTLMLKETEENFKQLEKELSLQQKIVWYFVISRFCFAEGSYSNAGIWLNRLIALPAADLSQDYQCYARIMNLVVAYESGNPDRIEHELRRAYYFLTKRNKIYNYERIILDYTRQAFRVRSEREVSELLEFMYRDLNAIASDPFEQNAFDAFDIRDWLKGKIKQ